MKFYIFTSNQILATAVRLPLNKGFYYLTKIENFLTKYTPTIFVILMYWHFIFVIKKVSKFSEKWSVPHSESWNRIIKLILSDKFNKYVRFTLLFIRLRPIVLSSMNNSDTKMSLFGKVRYFCYL